ncbi:MAG: MMPL family transporter, partial [Saprospiraceae bacterium]|nr:MMPL family transporter [Saprospiraceae bacterium]
MRFRIHPRTLSVTVFSILAVLSVAALFRLQFSFDFEQFFPEGDEDLAFFREFIEEFETDDNFLLVAVERKEGVFDSAFLNDFHQFSLDARALPYVEKSRSLTQVSYPLKTPFGVTAIPAIDLDQPETYARARERILSDERFVYNLISEDATALVLYLKIVDAIQLEQSRELMTAMEGLVGKYDFERYHYLGRPYFQKELVAMQVREVSFSVIVSGILVTLVMFFLFRRPWGIAISLLSIGLGMLLFMGYMGALGRELNAMSALYPVLMIIVGTSDVIHIMTKYIDELRKGYSRKEAIRTTIKNIGLATLLTSLTTAIGFASLLTSRIAPVRDFGINAAVGVMIAYITVIFFTTALLSKFEVHQLIRLGHGRFFWDRLMDGIYGFTLRHPRRIALGGMVVLALSLLGISMVSTNYEIIHNLPRGKKITADFRFFEKKLSGFRPMEFAVFAEGDYRADDFEVLQQIDTVEQYLQQIPEIRAIGSITAVYKSINQMYNGNRPDAYRLPSRERQFERYRRMAERIPDNSANVLVSGDGKKARITSRVLDMGADSVQFLGDRVDTWISEHTDPKVATFRRTGTGLIIDKNADYVRESLILGLGMAILVVSFLMMLLFRNWRMLLISVVPNT